MFDIGLGGLFTGPVSAIENVSDEKLKRAMERTAVSFGYSQYITFFWSLSQELQARRFLKVLSAPLRNMACSAYKMLLLSGANKEIDLAVPRDMEKYLEKNDPIGWTKMSNPNGG